MSKKMHVKKPQDATMRNVRAAKKRTITLADRLSRLETRVDVLVAYLRDPGVPVFR